MKDYNMLGREELIRERARYPLAQRRIEEIDAKLQQLDRDLDAAVEQHQRDCTPLQTQLQAIEDAQVASIVDRKPLDPAQETRRKDLLHEVEAANLRLEAARDEHQRLRRI